MLESVESSEDVQRMFVLLKPLQPGEAHYVGPESPSTAPKNRLLIVGKKHLPSIDSHEKAFGFVYKASEDVEEIVKYLREEEYDTKTRGYFLLVSVYDCVC